MKLLPKETKESWILELWIFSFLSIYMNPVAGEDCIYRTNSQRTAKSGIWMFQISEKMVLSLKQPPPQPTNPNMGGEDHPQNRPIVEWSYLHHQYLGAAPNTPPHNCFRKFSTGKKGRKITPRILYKLQNPHLKPSQKNEYVNQNIKTAISNS